MSHYFSCLTSNDPDYSPCFIPLSRGLWRWIKSNTWVIPGSPGPGAPVSVWRKDAAGRSLRHSQWTVEIWSPADWLVWTVSHLPDPVVLLINTAVIDLLCFCTILQICDWSFTPRLWNLNFLFGGSVKFCPCQMKTHRIRTESWLLMSLSCFYIIFFFFYFNNKILLQ